MKQAVVIGSGPAGLMAAEVMAQAGLGVTICEAKPSVGRKFLMAGKSGLNLTKETFSAPFLQAYAEAAGPLAPMIKAFGAQEVQTWTRDLGQQIFTGSSGRVFPKAMKASPLLRAWLGRLAEQGVQINTRWRWTGWDGAALAFDTVDGPKTLSPDVTVLALGGASWGRLGSDGAWAEILSARGVWCAPFLATNAGITVGWSEHMTRHFGTPLKGVKWQVGLYTSRGEAVVSSRGLEGGGIYTVSRGIREGHPVVVDLLPDLTVPQITARLSRPRGKASLSNHLRKTLNLTSVEIALLQEMARPLPEGLRAQARLIKALPIAHAGLRPIDEAISTAGGVPFDAVDDGLMLRALPGVFVAGEMLDWEAPTGGYLMTGCFATGRWAGAAAAHWAVR